MLGKFRATGSNDGNGDGARDRGSKRNVETELSAVAVDGSEEDFAGAEYNALMGPRERIAMGRFAGAADHDIPMVVEKFCIDGEDDGLRAEFTGEFGDQLWMRHGGGVDGDFVGTGEDDGASVFERADAATGGERNGEFGSDAADSIEKCRAAVAGSRNVEEDEFVGAFRVVTGGQSDGIAGIAQAGEIHAFDDARAVGVEAGNDAVREGHAASLRKFWRSCAPASPLFSG